MTDLTNKIIKYISDIKKSNNVGKEFILVDDDLNTKVISEFKDRPNKYYENENGIILVTDPKKYIIAIKGKYDEDLLKKFKLVEKTEDIILNQIYTYVKMKQYFILSEEDLDKYFNKIPLIAHQYIHLDESMLRKHIWNWRLVSRNVSLNLELLIAFEDKIWWGEVWRHIILTIPIIRAFPDKLNCVEMSKNTYLTMDILSKYGDKLNWDYVSFYILVTDELIEKYKDKLNWKELSRNKTLSVDIIRKYDEYFDWNIMIKENEALTTEVILELVSEGKFESSSYATK